MDYKNAKKVDSLGGYSVGDIIHIERYYYAAGSPNYDQFGNSKMVDARVRIESILTDGSSDVINCRGYSTSTTDVANKGIVLTKKQFDRQCE